MAAATSLVDFILGLALGSMDPVSGNRVSFEGLASSSKDDGTLAIDIRKVEAASLRVASGPLVLAQQPSAGAWTLAPLAAASGTIRAKIADAQLLFDADVTVPIRQGSIDFNDASVEHVGPDSRMGVSRLGLYVDAPSGRSYLYQFPSAPAGVAFEQRGALLGPWVTERGTLQLQAFVEGLLRQPPGGQALGFTEQARQLFDRTSVSGEVRLGDGRIAAPGLHADLAGRADGRNTIRLDSEAVGRGLTATIASLSVRNASLDANDAQLKFDEITGAIALRLFVEGARWRVALELASLTISGLHLQLRRVPGA